MASENREIDQESTPQKAKPTVIGIGASAGGLAALRRFFENVPADSGMAYVVVVHLSPDAKSHLADLLQPHVPFPVQQVTENMLLQPDQVYVIPPNANLSAIDTHLRLSKLEEIRSERAPIDHFFRTLANTHDGHAVGVILTGSGSDGTLGIKDIKAKGGLIVVQDPNEAEYDGMPQSAIATGLVDRILPIASMPDAILRYNRTEPKLPTVSDETGSAEAERWVIPKVLGLLRARTDRDFSRYKRSTILRRIARRMQLNYMEDLETYLERVREHGEEARALADDLLITVTSFFRDAEVFEKLANEILPSLLANKKEHDSVRVWSVGCATGEEAYSLAILLIEAVARQGIMPQLQVFASDLHKGSLDRAREGFYPEDIETDVGTERLERFFTRESGGYRIRKEVRDLVVFAPHNILADPPFSRLDMISCRNLMIYLEREVQRDVIELFHYALAPDGYLLLGSAETIDGLDLFRAEDKRLCLYRKRNVPAPEPRLPVFPLTRRRFLTDLPPSADRPPETPAYGALHQRMVEQYAPPSMLVNPENKVAHLSEHAGRFLVHPGGELTTNVLKLLREELRIELRSLLQTAREKKTAIDSRPVTVRFNGHSAPVAMYVRPALQPDQEGFVLVIFDERPGQIDSHAAVDRGVAEHRRIQELETDLAEARQRLQVIIEEYETGQEEMKSSNEEMQSTNEELRSTMEELETSKEELQSINEELQTVNQENRHKVEELSQLSSDLQNLLAASEIATLFLDRNLRILRFTPKLSELFNIRKTDRARPISDLTHRLGYSDLRKDAQSVLTTLIPIERELQDEAGRWYLTRVLPYRGTEDRIEGIVITFIDISRRRSVEKALRSSEERLQRALDIATVGVIFFEPGGRITRVNDAFLRLSGYDRRDFEAGRLRYDTLTPPEWMPVSRRAIEQILSTGSVEPYEKELLRKDGSRWFALCAGTKLGENEGVEYVIDITGRKHTEQALEAHEGEFKDVLVREVDHRVKSTFKVITDMLNLQARQMEDPKARSAFEIARDRVHAMAAIHEALDGSNSFKEVELGRYTKKLVHEVVRLYGMKERLNVEVIGDGASLELQQAVPFGIVINELISNVCKHAFPKESQGRVTVEVGRENHHVVLRVSDTGVGLPANFDREDPTTVGMMLLKNLRDQLGAEIRFLSKDGTTVEVRLPKEPPAYKA
jgi:two-component system CheB/CheR fusion protein